MTRCDLLVVGGGPAGSALAAMAAAKGARVILLEREHFPRDKVCGEFVSAEGCAVLARLGVLDHVRKVGAVPMRACLLADARGRAVTSKLPDLPGAGREALGISRAVMDEALLRHAASLGVDVREGESATAPIVEDGRVRGVRTKTNEYQAPLVVAADGRRSMLQRALYPGIGDPLRTAPSSWFGLKTHFPDPTGGLDGRIELYVFDGGYAGLGPIDGGRLNLALIVTVRALQACGGSPDQLMKHRMLRNPLLAARIGTVAPCSPWKTVGPLRFNVRKPAGHGVLFAGDAAGTIDPFSGEGMSNALRGAELALPFVLDAIAHGGLSETAERAWTRTWRSGFAPVTRRVRLIGRVFQHPRPASMAMSLLSLPHGARLLPSLVAATRTGGPR